MDDNQVWRGPDHSNRGEIGRRIIRQLPVQAFVDRLRAVSADEQRVPIRWSTRRFGRREIAADTRFILHERWLAECPPQMLGQKPRGQIGATSCREWNHDHDILAGPVLRRTGTGRHLRAKAGNGTENQAAAIDWHRRFLTASRAASLWRLSDTLGKSTVGASRLRGRVTAPLIEWRCHPFRVVLNVFEAQ